MNQLENQNGGGSDMAETPSGVQSDSANESFLLSGTLSRGLQQVGGDPGGDMGPGFGRGPGGFGFGPPGFGPPGGSGVFRAPRYGPDYPGLAGKKLTASKTIEELETPAPKEAQAHGDAN